ncbi:MULTISPECIES: type III restriction-modification system endonuclease [Enterobacteriaceae]|uniref:type III restriction-modification system endonuclease n=1 Tax=Enterobacteriaceae TaxID=543 RepID=UPI0001DC3FFE|nr:MULTISPECIES: DEAD/DEAH box helicase family protein [Enterobacteriaceae]EKY1765953.1 DEAD/DEAH box helicase family protein [Escherichia coli]EKZ9766164.1 DEAD/DEAH box helicase family protein [Klebsiella variicola]ELH5828994.1 DEAD/DEAH box helicase family protein [Salmonella enterica]ELT9322482.1 DEAD/DEAH box helicase family protein [Enterobacter kobei]MCJ5673119.1 DEAD/DEAH box helicase family protein [Klebsiella pneumoniae]HCB0532929.1 DEAD/DEAH box helicase family protein [Klebsiella 
MKLHFESDLTYQQNAITSVCDLFEGQEKWESEMTVLAPAQGALSFEGATGSMPVNPQIPEDDVLLKNLNNVQLKNQLPPSPVLDSHDFTVEMETGTGKTYVYLRTMLELNKRYGMSKFIIVVPSVAIKEGVYKTLQITEEHFKSLYAGVPYEYYLYDSAKPADVRNFATSSVMQIMVMTVGAINKKDVNKLYQSSEKTTVDDLDKPIDLIRATRPIIIVDEPQSVDGGLNGAGKTALDAMHPMFTLRYSATHVHKHHMVYRLDAIDAYNQKLVKQIEVAGLEVQNASNSPYVKLVSINSKKNSISATVIVDIADKKGGVNRSEITVHDGMTLDDETGRDIYQGYRISEIRTGKEGYLTLETPSNTYYMKVGDVVGDIDPMLIQRHMIRRTIREHLDKELRLNPQQIKVLTLFFIDKVDFYRQNNEEGLREPGEYARIFEEEYLKAIKSPAYKDLLPSHPEHAKDVHDGYFSIDKKGGWAETSESNNAGRENAERGYNLIMKNKEKLLSFSNPVRFIFSHSALKEGWDNPNVFQICSLREMGSERERRQTLGRGLRLCVNQEGERVRDDSINILTVVASENYEAYAERLQSEIENETGIRFGIIEKDAFAHVVTNSGSESKAIGVSGSNEIWTWLITEGYLEKSGKISKSLSKALHENTFILMEKYLSVQKHIEAILHKSNTRLNINNAEERVKVKYRKENFNSPYFNELWKRIKYKTVYKLDFSEEKLVEACAKSIEEMPAVDKATLSFSKAVITKDRSGLDVKVLANGTTTSVIEVSGQQLPDLLSVLQDKTGLTRRSLVQILKESGRINDFIKNPNSFINEVITRINYVKSLSIIDGIKYYPISSENYAQSLFNEKELTGYTRRMFKAGNKSLHEYINVDSDIEREFAKDLEMQEEVKLYTKLPNWFKIPTPLGNYNPDWALVINKNGEDNIYFVVETKSNLLTLRDNESGKIKCGKAHFESLTPLNENPAKYACAIKYEYLNSLE